MGNIGENDSDHLYELIHLAGKHGLRIVIEHNSGDERTNVVVSYSDGGALGTWEFAQRDFKGNDDALGAWLAELRNDLRRLPHAES